MFICPPVQLYFQQLKWIYFQLFIHVFLYSRGRYMIMKEGIISRSFESCTLPQSYSTHAFIWMHEKIQKFKFMVIFCQTGRFVNRLCDWQILMNWFIGDIDLFPRSTWFLILLVILLAHIFRQLYVRWGECKKRSYNTQDQLSSAHLLSWFGRIPEEIHRVQQTNMITILWAIGR